MSSVSFSSSACSNLKKRSAEAVEEDPSEQEVAGMSRSERKRHREKKRRSDVNKGFDDLMALLLEIDPEVRADAEDRASKGQCKRSLGAHEDNVLCRVDLIATAVRVLKRVHTENEKHKKMIDDFLHKNKGETMLRPPTAASMGASAQGLSDLNAFSAMERNALLQKSAALGLGGAAGGANPAMGLDAASQFRAQARMLGNMSSAGGLGDFSAADILAFRAANLPGAAASRDAALLSQFNASKQMLHQRNLLVQNMLQNHGQNLVAAETMYGRLGDPPAPNASNFSITEGLYGALGGGRSSQGAALQMKKEEELRKLRAAGHQV